MEGKVYLDNNSGTLVPSFIASQMSKYINIGNYSSDTKSAQKMQALVQEFKKFIYGITGSSEKQYEIIFNSGSSESNSTIIGMFRTNMRIAPHVITSSIEHKSMLRAIQAMSDEGKLTATHVKPDKNGLINPKNVQSAIKKSTKLVTIMHANNETGAINDIQSIYYICKEYNIPFYVDCAQTFGKIGINLNKCPVDGLCVSFQKMYGLGGGFLMLKKSFITKMSFKPIIYGEQQGGLRGGTLNMLQIGIGYQGLKYCMSGRAQKNEKMLHLKVELLQMLSQIYKFTNYVDYKKGFSGIVMIGHLNSYLQNTLLLSYANPNVEVCNKIIVKELEKRGVIVSVGSACNTKNKSASHVVNELSIPPVIKRSIIRISMSDLTSMNDIKCFVLAYKEVLRIFATKY